MRTILRSIAFCIAAFVMFLAAARADHATVEVRLVDPSGVELPTRTGKKLHLGPPLVTPFEVAHVRVHDAAVDLELGPATAKAFARATAANTGRSLAIVVGGVVQATPTIRDRVDSGHVSITLRSADAAQKLAASLTSP